MKLFLTSMAISPEQAPTFTKLVGKEPSDIQLALIENASDVYDQNSKEWANRNRDAIEACGYQVEVVDLRTFRGKREELRQKLASKDAMWLGGGNTYYLRWILQDTGADDIIKELVESGIVYGGGSAGAIVAGPTLQHFEDADDPNESPEVILEGLGLTNIVVVPHVGNEKYGEIMEQAIDRLHKDGYDTIAITDEQGVAFDMNERKIVP